MPKQRDPGADADAVLDAAASCYLRFGVAKTTAADIAQAVGISRATLYRRFGSHEAIFLALLTRESAAMAADADVHLARVEDPLERILEGMMFSIAEIGRRPVHAAVFGGDSAGMGGHAGHSGGGPAPHRRGGSPSAPGLVPCRRHASERDMMDLVDWILRILISYAAVPGNGGRRPDEVRRQLAAWFLPAFENLFGGRIERRVRH